MTQLGFTMTQDEKLEKAANYTEEMGISGLNVFSGYVMEEFLTELQGDRGRKVYREMADNDPIAGAFLYAVEVLLKAAGFYVEASEEDTDGFYKEWVEGVFNDMEHTFSDFLSEAFSMMVFGFSLLEMVFKRRMGPTFSDPSKKSKYTDGKIGIQMLAGRAQETLSRWDLDEKNNVVGFWQRPPNKGGEIYIPIERLLHFRTTIKKNNPEGRSILRNSYTSWFFKKNMQMIEAIGVERDLAGLPVMYVPNEILKNPSYATTKAQYTKVVRDLKYNSQAGLVLPSDLYANPDGEFTNNQKVRLELVSTSGTRSINIGEVVNRHERNQLLSVLGAYLLLGTGGGKGSSSGGSYALSQTMDQLFTNGLQSLLDSVFETLNRILLPRLWGLNGFDFAMMPTMRAGKVHQVDLASLGDFVQKISSAGILLGGDIEVENALREKADLPPVDEDMRQEMLDQQLTLPTTGQVPKDKTPGSPAEGQNAKTEEVTTTKKSQGNIIDQWISENIGVR